MTVVTRSASLSTQRSGFTLIELLVVFCILGIVVALGASAIQQARATAARVACLSRLRQVALAVHMYADSRQELPAGCDRYVRWFATPTPVRMSWHTKLLPYLEQDVLWRQVSVAYESDPTGDSAAHSSVQGTSLTIFRCPADSRSISDPNGHGGNLWGLASFQGIVGTNLEIGDGVFHIDHAIRFTSITDGTTNTIMIGERPPGPLGVYGAWYGGWGRTVCSLSQLLAATDRPWIPYEGVNCRLGLPPLRPGRIDDACSVTHFWSFHPGGSNFAFADGSARFLTNSIAPLLPDLATRAGGELVSIP